MLAGGWYCALASKKITCASCLKDACKGVDFTIDGREVGIYFVEPGDFCGELGLFDQGLQPEYVIALTQAVVISVPMAHLREIMLKTPSIATMLGAKMALRVRQLSSHRSLLALPNVSQRVCCQLWALVPEGAKGGSKAAEIKNPPTHMEIAIMLNLSRETVTRVFQSLQNRQIVKRDGSAILLVNDVAGLEKLANGSEAL